MLQIHIFILIFLQFLLRVFEGNIFRPFLNNREVFLSSSKTILPKQIGCQPKIGTISCGSCGKKQLLNP